MPGTAIDQLAGYAAALRWDAVPRPIIEHALSVVRDTIGTLLAGSVLPENAALAAAAQEIGGPGEATVVGGPPTTPHVAALVNGTAAVSLELDEGNQFAVNHPAVHVLPAALAVAEQQHASGQAFLEAVIAGYEVAVRVGSATRLRGPVHPFGTTAIIGAAAAAAKLQRMDATAMAAAMRLAAGMAVASSQTAAKEGASVRNLCTGLTGHNGVLAPMLARSGFTGEPDGFAAVFGRVLGSAYDPELLHADPGIFFISRNYFKLHACSRWNHAPVEAAAVLMVEEHLDPAAIERVVVWTFDPATRLSERNPANGYAAKHSIPYNVAVRIVRGTNGLEAYSDEAVSDPAVRALAGRVEVREDPELTALVPDLRAARVEVILAGGDTRTAAIARPPGGFDNPYDREVLLNKFKGLARRALPDEAIAVLLRAIEGLPQAPGMRRLTAPLAHHRGVAPARPLNYH